MSLRNLKKPLRHPAKNVSIRATPPAYWRNFMTAPSLAPSPHRQALRLLHALLIQRRSAQHFCANPSTAQPPLPSCLTAFHLPQFATKLTFARMHPTPQPSDLLNPVNCQFSRIFPPLPSPATTAKTRCNLFIQNAVFGYYQNRHLQLILYRKRDLP